MSIKIECEFEDEEKLFQFICYSGDSCLLKIDDDILFKLFNEYSTKYSYFGFLDKDIVSCELFCRCCLILDDVNLKDIINHYEMETFECNEELLERIVKLDHRYYKEIKNPPQRITDLYKTLTL